MVHAVARAKASTGALDFIPACWVKSVSPAFFLSPKCCFPRGTFLTACEPLLFLPSWKQQQRILLILLLSRYYPIYLLPVRANFLREFSFLDLSPRIHSNQVFAHTTQLKPLLSRSPRTLALLIQSSLLGSQLGKASRTWHFDLLETFSLLASRIPLTWFSSYLSRWSYLLCWFLLIALPLMFKGREA